MIYGTGFSEVAEEGEKMLIFVLRPREVDGKEYFVRVPVDTLLDDSLVSEGILGVDTVGEGQ
jgi:hypothetical protein